MYSNNYNAPFQRNLQAILVPIVRTSFKYSQDNQVMQSKLTHFITVGLYFK
jgi:hypothetical protein